MKHNSKRLGDKAAIGFCNCLAYNKPRNKHVVSRDYNFASLLGVIAITNLFPIQHKFVQYLPPWLTTPLSKNNSAKLLDYSSVATHNDFSLFTNHGTLFYCLVTLASFTIYSCIFYQGYHVSAGTRT